MMIDNGLPVRYFADVVASAAEHVDLVKFGWGTALVTPRLAEKLACLQDAGIGYFVGGTLFEKFVAQGRLDDYRRLVARLGCQYVEVSNGTIGLGETEKADLVADLAQDWIVLAEVGSKLDAVNRSLAGRDWARQVRTDLAHGARWVILEARESGTTGIATSDGQPRDDLFEALAAAGIDPDNLLFEAPTKALQTTLVNRYGPEVNLGNVAPADLVALETLRLGLRSDTMAERLTGADLSPADLSPADLSPADLSPGVRRA